MSRCKNCLLPASVPNSDIDQNHLCRLCRQRIRHPAPWENSQERNQKDLADVLAFCRASPARYQVLVCLSGGKDSLMLLYKLKVEYGLRVLAFTTDSNIPDLAWDNIRRTVGLLGVDHVVYRPSLNFYQKLFRYLLMNQEERGAVYTVSYVYAPLFEGDALRVATERGIPAVFAGYSPGQPEPERMVYEFDRSLIEDTNWTPPELASSDAFNGEDLSRFWNPHSFPRGTPFPRYIAPFHAWPYNQEAIMKEVVTLGLVKNASYASPIRSNYPINWLLMYSDLRNFGYNPYAPEFSALIREGKASRRHWAFMTPVVNFMIRHKVLLGSEVTRSMNKLELQDSDLKINKPHGAYDPVMIQNRSQSPKKVA